MKLFVSCVCVLTAFLAVSSRGQEHDKDSVGVTLSKSPGVKDIGLPIYPASKPHKDEPNDSGANLGLWGGGSGVKLSALKMETPDTPDKVATFYKKALAKYGKVLDCTGGAKAEDSSKTLTCDDDKPEKGTMIFKAGTKEKQHIVTIETNGKLTVYKLVYVNVWATDKKESDTQ